MKMNINYWIAGDLFDQWQFVLKIELGGLLATKTVCYLIQGFVRTDLDCALKDHISCRK